MSIFGKKRARSSDSQKRKAQNSPDDAHGSVDDLFDLFDDVTERSASTDDATSEEAAKSDARDSGSRTETSAVDDGIEVRRQLLPPADKHLRKPGDNVEFEASPDPAPGADTVPLTAAPTLATRFATRRERREYEAKHGADAIGESDLENEHASASALQDRGRTSERGEVTDSGTSSPEEANGPAPSDHDSDFDFPPQEAEPDAPRHKGLKRIMVWSSVVIVIALIALLGVRFAGGTIGAIVGKIAPSSQDYTGSGTTRVTFRVEDGQSGQQIGENLVKVGIIKSYAPFLTAYNSMNPAPVFHMGMYPLKRHMKAADALKVLSDQSKSVSVSVVIPEGYRAAQIYALLAKRTGISVAAFKAEAQNISQFHVPAGAPSLEGFLFPATYDFDRTSTAKSILTTLTDRSQQSLVSAGIASGDQLRIVTFASIVQAEAGSVSDMGKVARVFQNRLDQNMKLQSDATVAYGTGNTNRLDTTDAERADSSDQYNTYAHSGLPVGPIGNPGDAAIQAVLSPTPGPWLFFVTVNPDTGETKFATTAEEHAQNVKEWQAWEKAHS